MAPKRGSKEPGTYWLYNNWDFNTAGAAFERMTGKNIYDALRDDLAIPIGMQDFDRERQQKSGDLTRSQYPAYHMVLSTRDMARLGLLMLRQGKWRDRQIIPAEWVRRSTSVRTPLAEMQPRRFANGPFGYGYMWWVWDGPSRPVHTRVPTRHGLLRPIHYRPASARYGRRAQNLAHRRREPERVFSPA